MKKNFLLFAFSILFLSCSKKEERKKFPFDAFIFSSAGLDHINSIKFTKSDTVYFSRIFPEPIQNFYAVLNLQQKRELNQLLGEVNFEKMDTIYANSTIEDATTHLINISNKEKIKYIYLYAQDAPKELKIFIESLGEIKGKLKFIPSNKAIDFGNLKSILPPPPPSMHVKKVN